MESAVVDTSGVEQRDLRVRVGVLADRVPGGIGEHQTPGPVPSRPGLQLLRVLRTAVVAELVNQSRSAGAMLRRPADDFGPTSTGPPPLAVRAPARIPTTHWESLGHRRVSNRAATPGTAAAGAPTTCRPRGRHRPPQPRASPWRNPSATATDQRGALRRASTRANTRRVSSSVGFDLDLRVRRHGGQAHRMPGHIPTVHRRRRCRGRCATLAGPAHASTLRYSH